MDALIATAAMLGIVSAIICYVVGRILIELRPIMKLQLWLVHRKRARRSRAVHLQLTHRPVRMYTLLNVQPLKGRVKL